eukprot:m.810151 g.810151  ORF g.810151 m.810151 type:complete len:603 (+) comp23383_c1_seq53:219-2027(+)
MSDVDEREHAREREEILEGTFPGVSQDGDGIEAPSVSYSARLLQSSQVLKDALPWAQSASNIGFDVAGKITSMGFAIAQSSIKAASYACVVGGAALATAGAATAGPVLIAGGVGLAALNEGVGLAKDITLGSQSIGKLISHHSIGTTSKAMELFGVEDGKGVRLIFGGDFVQAADFINTMVTSFLGDVPEGIEHKDLYHAFGALSQIHADSGYGLPLNSSATPLIGAVDSDVKRYCIILCCGLSAIMYAVYYFNVLRLCVIRCTAQNKSPYFCANCVFGRRSRYVRFSAAIYGWLPTMFLGVDRPSVPPEEPTAEHYSGKDVTAFCQITSLDPQDIVDFSLGFVTGGLYAPGYVIALDHATASVVVVIRGTMRVQDAVTDLVCSIAPMDDVADLGPDGAHDGMLKSAKRLSVIVLPKVQDALTAHPKYRVVLTGHSLGAGVASLIGTLWGPSLAVTEAHRAPVRVWAYAPPCVLTRAAALRTAPHITSIVCGSDVVTRFGLATTVDLRNMLVALVVQQRATADAEPAPAPDASATLAHLRRDVLSDEPKLFPAGKILWLDTDTDGSGAVFVADPECFDMMALKSGMFSSHLPQFYLRAVENA